MGSHNIRFQEVAANKTAEVIVADSDTAKLQTVIVRRVSGAAVETVTLISNGATLIDLKVSTDYDIAYKFYAQDVRGLKVTTSALAHAWVGVYAEANRGVHPDRV
jgi:hypothetical protein